MGDIMQWIVLHQVIIDHGDPYVVMFKVAHSSNWVRSAWTFDVFAVFARGPLYAYVQC